MLEPTGRSLYVDALRPPVGYRLAEAVATTYSLDLTTMLGIPIALALPHLDARTLGKESAVTLLDAIRRTSDRVTVFCNRGSMGVPGASHVLYGQLEKVIVEVGAPGGGCLHSKLWALRFAAEEAGDESLMRLVVLSRNLSADRCWDVCATFDGHITGRNRAANRPLYNLVSSLPKWAVRPAPPDVGGRAERLASQLHRTEWELPRGFEEIAFHVLGLDGVRRPWLPEASRRLVVISPFVRAGPLAKLSDTTDAAVALISRGEELDRLPADVRDRFNTVKVLHERAETESSEETVAGSPTTSLRGLHAKVYIAERGWNTHWYVGSANATHSALLEGMNIELLVELIGKTSKDPHKGIDGLLADDGLGAILTDYRPAAPEIDPIEEAAQRALDNAVAEMSSGKLALRFDPLPGEHAPVLYCTTPLEPIEVGEVRAWLPTTDSSSARDVVGLWQHGRASLATCATASATGLVAFELRAQLADVRKQFTLNLPVENMPADRDAQVVRVVIDNRERFLAYLLALLEGLDPDVIAGIAESLARAADRTGYGATSGILERLVRTRARDPGRLRDLATTVRALLETSEGSAIVPEDFVEVWAAVSEESSP